MVKRIAVVGSEHLQTVLSACLAHLGPDAHPMAITVQDVSDIRLVPEVLWAATDADAIVLATEWPQFLSFDLVAVRRVMRGDLFFDGGNNFDPALVERCGFRYVRVNHRAAVQVSPRIVVRSRPLRDQMSDVPG